jgi:NAD(P)-dependent dehydrogenase (short-subunit alcohol dehydrogenase family)
MENLIVTGTSSGIGYGVAKEFVRCGYRVFGGVRREADAEKLRAELGEDFVPLLMDVTDAEAIRRCVAEVEEIVGNERLAGLVNNAGVAIGGPLMHQPPEEIRHHFEVNVLGLISVTRAFLPLLGAKHRPANAPGRIVNISSVGGRNASPFIGAYAGTKHAVEGVSDSLRRELLLYGIDVIVVRPGAVKTEIWGKASATAEGGRYSETDYAPALKSFISFARSLSASGYSPEEFGGLVRRAFEAKRPKTRYVFTRGRFVNWTLPAHLPDRVVDRLIARNIGLLER